MKQRLSSGLPLLVFALLAALLLGSTLWGGTQLYLRDELAYSSPLNWFVHRCLAEGTMPLWNPLSQCGSPLWAEPHAALLFPLNWWNFLFPGWLGLAWSLGLRLTLAALTMFGLLRELQRSRGAALLGAAAFAFGSYSLGRLEFHSFYNAIAVFPLPLWWYLRACRLGTPRAIALAAVGYALLLLTAYAQAILLGSILLNLAALCRMFTPRNAFIGVAWPHDGVAWPHDGVAWPHDGVAWPHDGVAWPHGIPGGHVVGRDEHTAWPPRREDQQCAPTGQDSAPVRPCHPAKPLLILLPVVIGGVLLTAAQLWPSYEFTQLSQRSTAMSVEDAGLGSMSPASWITFFAPYWHGGPDLARYHGPGWQEFWANSYYVGSLTLVLACLGLVAIRRRECRFPATLGLIVSLAGAALAVGKYAPGWHGWLMRWIPFFGQVRWPANNLLLTVAGLSILAAVGFDTLSSTSERDWRSMTVAGALLLLFIVSAVSLAHDFTPEPPPMPLSPPPNPYARAIVPPAVSFAFLATGLLLIAVTIARPSPRLRAGMIILLLVDLYLHGRPLIPAGPPLPPLEEISRTGTVGSIATQLRSTNTRWLASHPTQDMVLELYGITDPAAWETALACGIKSTPLYWNLPHIWGGGTLRAESYEDFYSALGRSLFSRGERPDLESPLLRLANTGIVTHRLPTAHSATPEIFSVAHPLPRAFLVRSGGVSTDPQRVLAALLEPGFDPSRTVFLEEMPTLELNAQSDAGGDAITLEDHLSRVDLHCTLNSNALLVLTDLFYPGWRAEVDGKPARILRADGTFRALALEAGRHVVTFRFEPASVRWGIAISALTGLLMALLPPLLGRRRF